MKPEPQTSEDGVRAQLLDQLARLFADWGAGQKAALRSYFANALAGFDDSDFETFLERLRTTGTHWGYHPPDPVGRVVSRVGHALVATEASSLLDEGGLDDARRGPVIFAGNHLSFIDANTVDFLLCRAGWQDVADRLTVMAGPKVYAEPIRRVASLCFGTIKAPQSTSRASGAAVMSRRETLRLAALTLEQVRDRRARGEHLLVFSEGSRSRMGAMQRILAAVARYLEQPYARVVPFAVWGTEQMVPVDDERAHRSEVHVHIGRAFDAARLFEHAGRRRTNVSDTLGFLTADLLPPAYRGCYASASEELAGARALANMLR